MARRIPRNYFLQQIFDVIDEVVNNRQEKIEENTQRLSKDEIVNNYLDEFEPMMHRGKHCLVYYFMDGGQCNGTLIYFLEGDSSGMLYSTKEDLSRNPHLANPIISNFALCGCKVVYLSPITFGEFKSKNKLNSTDRYTDDTEGVEIFDTTCKSRYFVEKDDPELRKLRCLGESFTPELLAYLSRPAESTAKPKTHNIKTYSYEGAKKCLINGQNVSRMAWQGNRYLTEQNVEALGKSVTMLVTRVGEDDCEISVWNPTEEDVKAFDYHVVTFRRE